MRITKKIVSDFSCSIFVFGDNCFRTGHKGQTFIRDFDNTYSFVVRKREKEVNESYYKPYEYKPIFERELRNITKEIKKYSDTEFIFMKIGKGAENKYKIWEEIIFPGIDSLRKYKNVSFAWEIAYG